MRLWRFDTRFEEIIIVVFEEATTWDPVPQSSSACE